MKKFIFLTLAISSILLSGCTKESNPSIDVDHQTSLKPKITAVESAEKAKERFHSDVYHYIKTLNIEVNEEEKSILITIEVDDSKEKSDAQLLGMAEEVLKEINRKYNPNLKKGTAKYGVLYDEYSVKVDVYTSANKEDHTKWHVNQFLATGDSSTALIIQRWKKPDRNLVGVKPMTMAIYDQICIGMSEKSLFELAGVGETMSEVGQRGDPYHSVMYCFYADNGIANAVIILIEDRVESKAQFGLS